MIKEILIVEDEPLIALMYSLALKKNNYSVREIITSGEKALQETLKNKPSLIIMDIFLDGEMDGITAAQKIKEQYDIPLIFVSGNSDDKTRERAIKLNPLAYLVKPVDMKEIIKIIEDFNKPI